VLVEKPITETLTQAESLTEAAEASGLVVQVGHIERFNTAYIEMKNVFENMKVLAVNFRRLSPFEGSNVDVDVVLDLMIHDTNLVLDLMGQEPAWIEAHGLSVFSNTIDHAVAQMGFPSGQMFTLTVSRVTEHKVRAIEVTAREAFMECDLLNKSILVHRHTIGEYLNHNHRGVKYRQESIVERIQIPIFEPQFLELQHFVDSITEHQTPSVSARDGLNALRLVDLIRQKIMPGIVNLGERSVAAPAPQLVTN
jgi:predicted dehydrogenase